MPRPASLRSFLSASQPRGGPEHEVAKPAAPRLSGAAVWALLPLGLVGMALAGWSGGGEDVRVRLCKDIVAVQPGAAPVFQSAEARPRGREHLEVRVEYTRGSEAGSTSCFYAYNAPDDTAQQLADPLTAYSASPYRVIIGMQTLSKPALAEAIKQAMARQGKQFLQQAGTAARSALGQ